MKGYIVNGKAYIFPQTAAEIPEVEADVFYVQEENFTEWVAENESIADKLVKYNYNLISVQPKVWAGHTDDDLEPAQKEDPELAWSEDSATVTIGADDNVFPTLTNPHSVTVSYSSSDGEKATIDASTGEITLVAAGDTTISAVFAGDDTYEAQTVTYTLTVEEQEHEEYDVEVDAWDNVVTLGTYSSGTEINATYDANFGNIVGVTPSNLQYTLNDDQLTFTMPDETVSFTSELPAEGTSFNFTGYEDNVTETPSSTGTVDYNGIDSDYPTYIIGMAHVTFTGSEQEVEQTVYILRSDAPNMKNGTRIPVYTLNSDQFVQFGYGELTQQ